MLFNTFPSDVVFKHIKTIIDVRPVHLSRPKRLYKVQKKIIPINDPIVDLPPYRDYHHYTQKSKPWILDQDQQTLDENRAPSTLWWDTLRKMNEELQLNINIKKVGFKSPSLGLFPTFNMIEQMKKHREGQDSVATVSGR